MAHIGARVDAVCIWMRTIADLHGAFRFASPVAASALDSPLRPSRSLLLNSKDPHLLPDLTAAADILPPEAGAK